MENKKNNNVILKGIITGLIISIIVLTSLYVTGNIDLIARITNKNKNDDTKKLLTRKEALKIGKKLYNKATEAYETWQILPYCGTSKKDISNKKIIEFRSGSKMYESDFKDLNDLKKHLSTFLSDQIINDHIKEEAITDPSILNMQGKEKTNYLIKDGKLYCRANSSKEWLSRYLNEYKISVYNIKEKLIIYDVKLTNVSEYVATKTDSKCTYGAKLADCQVDEIEHETTKFVIEKRNKNWVVTHYKMHN